MLILLIASLVILNGCSKISSRVSPETDLTKAETTQLFSGKTVEGIHVFKDYSFKAYFDPTGSIRVTYDTRQKRKGTWRIDDKGQKCVQWEGKNKEYCAPIVNEAGVYKEFKVMRNGKRKHTVTFKKFIDGNPYDL
jgi:hypothetical protein